MSTGSKGQLTLAPWTTLLDALCNHLDLTGTNEGCDSACTVPVDGRPVNSCLTLAVMKDGSNITMFEGLNIEEVLHPLRQAFIDHDAFQCRYCTPGEICSAAALLAEDKAKSVDERQFLPVRSLPRQRGGERRAKSTRRALGTTIVRTIQKVAIASIFAFSPLAFFSMMASTAQAGPIVPLGHYCLAYDLGGTDCSFTSYAQCQATASGLAAVCYGKTVRDEQHDRPRGVGHGRSQR